MTRIVLGNKNTGKVVKTRAAKRLFFATNECCLSSLSPKRVDIKRIGSALYRMFTFSMEKTGLSALDTNRWICNDGIKTYSFGH